MDQQNSDSSSKMLGVSEHSSKKTRRNSADHESRTEILQKSSDRSPLLEPRGLTEPENNGQPVVAITSFEDE